MIVHVDPDDPDNYVDGELKSILDPEIFIALREFQEELSNVTIQYEGRTITWADLCNKPVLGVLLLVVVVVVVGVRIVVVVVVVRIVVVVVVNKSVLGVLLLVVLLLL